MPHFLELDIETGLLFHLFRHITHSTQLSFSLTSQQLGRGTPILCLLFSTILFWGFLFGLLPSYSWNPTHQDYQFQSLFSNFSLPFYDFATANHFLLPVSLFDPKSLRGLKWYNRVGLCQGFKKNRPIICLRLVGFWQTQSVVFGTVTAFLSQRRKLDKGILNFLCHRTT